MHDPEYIEKDGVKYLKVGSYTPPDEEGNGEVIDREYFQQGYIFKDAYAYMHEPDKVCYIPELSEEKYTREDFLRICNGQKDFADQLFDGVDWQHPESLKEDWFVNNEWLTCPNCGNLVDYGDGCNDKKCPNCGTEVED